MLKTQYKFEIDKVIGHKIDALNKRSKNFEISLNVSGSPITQGLSDRTRSDSPHHLPSPRLPLSERHGPSGLVLLAETASPNQTPNIPRKSGHMPVTKGIHGILKLSDIEKNIKNIKFLNKL